MIIIIWNARRVVTASAAQLSLFFSLINSELFFPAAVIRQTRGLCDEVRGREEAFSQMNSYTHIHTYSHNIYIYTAPLDAHTHPNTRMDDLVDYYIYSVCVYILRSYVLYYMYACVYIILYIYSSYNNNNIIVYRFEHAVVYIPPCGRCRCRKLLWVS